MKNPIVLILAILIAGLGVNHWQSQTHADEVMLAIDQHAERHTRQTVEAVADSASATIEQQFGQERQLREREFNQLVDAVDRAASTAVANQFQKEREANQALAAAQREQYLQATYIAQGMNAARVARTAIAEYYHMNDRFPRSNREAGLPEPAEFSDQALTSLVISHKGEIILNYNRQAGVHRGVIRLAPTVHASHMIRWQCTSPNFRTIHQTAPNCKYDPNA